MWPHRIIETDEAPETSGEVNWNQQVCLDALSRDEIPFEGCLLRHPIYVGHDNLPVCPEHLYSPRRRVGVQILKVLFFRFGARGAPLPRVIHSPALFPELKDVAAVYPYGFPEYPEQSVNVDFFTCEQQTGHLGYGFDYGFAFAGDRDIMVLFRIHKQCYYCISLRNVSILRS